MSFHKHFTQFGSSIWSRTNAPSPSESVKTCYPRSLPISQVWGAPRRFLTRKALKFEEVGVLISMSSPRSRVISLAKGVDHAEKTDLIHTRT